jgi:hypothetical protein
MRSHSRQTPIARHSCSARDPNVSNEVIVRCTRERHSIGGHGNHLIRCGGWKTSCDHTVVTIGRSAGKRG